MTSGSNQENRKSIDGDDREEQPGQVFHEEFAEELAERGLSERVRYAVSVDRLEGHLAAQFAPITGADLQERVDTIAVDVLASAFVDALVGTEVDPESAALPVEALRAVVVGAREPEEGWEFSEAAGRGSAGWTARFIVDTEVDLTLVGAPLIGAEHTRPLRAVGQVTVAPDGQVVEVTVDSVEALPGDPMRARWVRRAGRPLIDVAQLSSVTEALKAQQDAQAKMIRDATPALTDALKAQQEEWSKTMRHAMPGLADVLRAQQHQWAEAIRDATPGITGLNDMLKKQQAEWAKMIQVATPALTGINDALKAQQEQWATMIRDATGGLAGRHQGRGFPEVGNGMGSDMTSDNDAEEADPNTTNETDG
ncbi:hypothetical protein [Mycobacterium sp. URHB0021]